MQGLESVRPSEFSKYYYHLKIFYNVEATNSPAMGEMMKDNSDVEQSDTDMRYESNKKNIVQVQ